MRIVNRHSDLWHFKIGILTLSLMTGAAPPAWASSFSISNVTLTDYENISLTGGALGSNAMTGVYSGQIDLTTSLGNLGTWCVDLFHEIAIGGQYNASFATLATNNMDSPTALTSAQESQIAAIAALGNALLQPSTTRTFDAVTLAAFTTDLANFRAANPTGYATVTTNLSTSAAAVQAAIWGVEYNTTATNASDANFGSALSAVAANASLYFGNISGNQLNVTDGNGNHMQALFLSSSQPVRVPEPSTLAVFSLGLAGLYVARRRRAVERR
jgi:hypothetical protein